MIFDDSHLHEVWNDCDSQRIVCSSTWSARCLSAFDTQSSDHLDHSPITECRRTDGPNPAVCGNSSKPAEPGDKGIGLRLFSSRMAPNAERD